MIFPDEEARAAEHRRKLEARQRACVARSVALAGDAAAAQRVRDNVQPLVDYYREREQLAGDPAGEPWPC